MMICSSWCDSWSIESLRVVGFVVKLDASNGFFGCEWAGKPYGNPLIENMMNFQNDLMLNTSTLPAQSFVSEDAGNIPSARARVLGGGSSLIAGFFTYSSPEYVASMGWDGKLVNESYTWVTPIIAEIPELQIFQSTAKAGLLEAGVVHDNGGTFQHLISTKVGGSIFDHTGRRHTAADLLQYSNPDRATVLLWANTQRVLFDLSNVLSILCRIRHAGPHLWHYLSVKLPQQTPHIFPCNAWNHIVYFIQVSWATVFCVIIATVLLLFLRRCTRD